MYLCSDRIWLDGLCGVSYCAGNKRPTVVQKITNQCSCSYHILYCMHCYNGCFCEYFKIVIEWYYVFAAIIASFVIYMVATGGWERVKTIWDKTKYKKYEGE